MSKLELLHRCEFTRDCEEAIEVALKRIKAAVEQADLGKVKSLRPISLMLIDHVSRNQVNILDDLNTFREYLIIMSDNKNIKIVPPKIVLVTGYYDAALKRKFEQQRISCCTKPI